VRIEQSTRDGCTIVALTGDLDRSAAPRIQQLLLRRLREQPLAVICDLAGVGALDPARAGVFATAADHPASGWIAPKLLLCSAQPAVAALLAGLPEPHRLPVHPSVEDAITQAVDDAVDQARNDPLWLRHELALAPSPTAPAAARRFVHARCACWDLLVADDPDDPVERAWLADRVDRAVLLASELVTNAVVHARSELRLLREFHGDQLQLAEGGRGLLLGRRLPPAGRCSTLPKAARSSRVCWTSRTDPNGQGHAPAVLGGAGRWSASRE
jgi:anti-anti-sigma regulatory factor